MSPTNLGIITEKDMAPIMKIRAISMYLQRMLN